MKSLLLLAGSTVHVLVYLPLFTGDSQRNNLANSEDPDERQHNVAFHEGLHCLLRQKQSSEKEIQFY